MSDDSQWARPADAPHEPLTPRHPRTAADEGDSTRAPGALPLGRGEVVLAAKQIEHKFRRGSEEVVALDGVDIELFRGELVALVGPSGSGKTTLLNVLCGWEAPDRGTVCWNGHMAQMADVEWDGLALVPQTPGLIEDLTIAENIGLPCRFRNDSFESTLQGVDEVLSVLGLTELRGRYPDEVSLGEQQRTSVARALVLRPDLLLADEPTAHQDARSMDRVLKAIRLLVESGKACMVASHNPEVLDAADRVVEMRDGRLSERL
jgi:ABC-type lipoprotein export system ATPase subunit